MRRPAFPCRCISPSVFPTGRARMIPGTSRAGATIVGAMLFGADRRSAAEFSFWLAMPTMVGAFAFEAFKNRHDLAHGNILAIAVGFVFAFIFGWIVVKTFLGYVQNHFLRAVCLVAHRGRRFRPLRALSAVDAAADYLRHARYAARLRRAGPPKLAGLAEAPRYDGTMVSWLRLDLQPFHCAQFGAGRLRDHVVDAKSST